MGTIEIKTDLGTTHDETNLKNHKADYEAELLKDIKTELSSDMIYIDSATGAALTEILDADEDFQKPSHIRDEEEEDFPLKKKTKKSKSQRLDFGKEFYY